MAPAAHCKCRCSIGHARSSTRAVGREAGPRLALHHIILSFTPRAIIPSDPIRALKMMNDPLHRFPKKSSPSSPLIRMMASATRTPRVRDLDRVCVLGPCKHSTRAGDFGRTPEPIHSFPFSFRCGSGNIPSPTTFLECDINSYATKPHGIVHPREHFSLSFCRSP